MQRVFSYRQGDRAEYLAQYIISAFAISVPVPRQEDVGSDFHCSLLSKVENNLRPYLPFNIQIKSNSDRIKESGILFGGMTESGKWRNHEIEQLCQTEVPFLLGIVDKENQWLDLFSTITRYFVRNNWLKKKELPRQVNLMPYSPSENEDIGCGSEVALPAQTGIPDYAWQLPIGQPIVRITISDSEDVDKCENIKMLLEPYLRMDQDNAVLARIGLGYFTWPLRITTNKPLVPTAVGLVSSPFDETRFRGQLLTTVRIVASLLRSYELKGLKEKILPWEAILSQLPIGSDEVVDRTIRETLKYALL